MKLLLNGYSLNRIKCTCKVQLILRSCGCGVGERSEHAEQMAGLERDAARSSAWQALHLTLTFSKLSVFKIEKFFYLFMHSNFRQALYLSAGYSDFKA